MIRSVVDSLVEPLPPPALSAAFDLLTAAEPEDPVALVVDDELAPVVPAPDDGAEDELAETADPLPAADCATDDILIRSSEQ